MGLRGPKPVSVDSLKADARDWASFFYTLRDGQSGYMQRVKRGRVQSTGSAKPTPIQSGRGRTVPAKTKYRTGQPLSPPILIPVSDAARLLPQEMSSKDWVIFRPTMPAPELWELLKRARSVGEIRKVSREMRKWMDKEFGRVGRWLAGSPPLEFCHALELYADQVLIGKRLPSYAKTDRPSSDDKRVQFFAEVLAGARYGLAPITAVKRLSHWRWPKDSDEKTLKEFLDLSRKKFEQRQQMLESRGA